MENWEQSFNCKYRIVVGNEQIQNLPTRDPLLDYRYYSWTWITDDSWAVFLPKVWLEMWPNNTNNSAPESRLCCSAGCNWFYKLTKFWGFNAFLSFSHGIYNLLLKIERARARAFFTSNLQLHHSTSFSWAFVSSVSPWVWWNLWRSFPTVFCFSDKEALQPGHLQPENKCRTKQKKMKVCTYNMPNDEFDLLLLLLLYWLKAKENHKMPFNWLEPIYSH